MMEVKKLLDDYGIDYLEQGKNIGKDHVGIPCPYCGDDPSTHLGINIFTGHWSCWRDESHRGTLPKLLGDLLHIPYKKAKEIVQEYSSGEETPPVTPKVQQKIRLPGELERIYDGSAISGYAYHYMRKRGFSDAVLNRFPLYGTITGELAYRVVFPIYMNDLLVAWTGRTTIPDREPRYKSNHPAEGAFPISSYLGFHDNARRCTGTLFLCEGPMDALKLNMLFAENEGAAVCLFGKQLHPNQLGLLQSLVKHYKQVRVVLDADAKADAMNISNQVALITYCRPLFLTDVKDPGELDAVSFMQAFSKFRNATSSAR